MDYMLANNQECSSGCESGWTLYLDHSSISPTASCGRRNNRSLRVFRDATRSKVEEEEEEEDEDLSMVSDASSGPPHVHDHQNDTNGCLNRYAVDDHALSRNRKKNRETSGRRRSSKVQDLDDTASSPFFDFSNKSSTLTTNKTSVLEYSQGYSTTQFEQVRPTYQQHYDAFFQSSLSGNQLQQQNQW